MAQQLDDLSRSPTPLDQDSTIIAVIEMSQATWLVAGIVPGIERHPLKKIEPNEVELLCLLMRWRAEAMKKGRTITRIVVAFEAGRDGFWLARWLRVRDIESYVIHPTSVAVSREHRRAKTDRLDTGLLKRVFIGWLRGEPDHCHMAAIPTLAEEDAKRPNREREGLVRERTRLVNRMKSCLVRFGVRTFKPTLRNAPDRLATLHTPEGVPLPPNTLLELRRDMARLRFVMDQIKEVEAARAQGLKQAPQEKTHAMVNLLARIMGIGIDTADMLVHEVLVRKLARSKSRRPLCGPDRLTRRERQPAARERARQGGQRPRPARDDPTGLALSAVPEGECARAVVPGADCRRPWRHAQDHDRGPGQKAANRAVANADHWRGAGWRRLASRVRRRRQGQAEPDEQDIVGLR